MIKVEQDPADIYHQVGPALWTERDTLDVKETKGFIKKLEHAYLLLTMVLRDKKDNKAVNQDAMDN